MMPTDSGSQPLADFEELGKLAMTLAHRQELRAASYVTGILQTDLAEQGLRPISKTWPVPGQAAPEGWDVYKAVLCWFATSCR